MPSRIVHSPLDATSMPNKRRTRLRKNQKDSLKAFSQDESKRKPPILRFFLFPVKPARRNRQHSVRKFLSAKYRKIERKAAKSSFALSSCSEKFPFRADFSTTCGVPDLYEEEIFVWLQTIFSFLKVNEYILHKTVKTTRKLHTYTFLSFRFSLTAVF